MKVRGIVIKIKAESLLLITPTGEFRQVPIPADLPRVGEEIEVNLGSMWRRKLITMVAAALLFLAVGSQLYPYKQFIQPVYMQPVSYVALDINPSIGLYLDHKQQIVRGEGLNQAGNALLNEVQVKGLPLNQGLECLVKGAIHHNYIRSGGDNIIMTAVVSLREEGSAPDLETVVAAINIGLDAEHQATVVAQSAQAADLQAARKEKVSLNKHLVWAKGIKKGKELPLSALQNSPLGQILEDAGTNIQELLLETDVAPGRSYGEKKGHQTVVTPAGVVITGPPGQIKKIVEPAEADKDERRGKGFPGDNNPAPSEGKGSPRDASAQVPPGQQRQQGPPAHPPGLGKYKRHGVMPPGLEKSREAKNPPGRVKKRR
ncbi:MAG: anti-sigma factor domain-containing protein [bacterium]|jgi:hypothetical protein